MAEVGSKEAVNSKVPDLYRLLELQSLEPDRTKIEHALKRVLRMAKNASTTDKRGAKKAARLLELGKLHLLNAKRKAAYDLRWSNEYGDASSNQPAQADWNWSLVEPFLPKGDPELPFDLSAFLAQPENSPEFDPSSDFEQLVRLLGKEQVAVETTATIENAESIRVQHETPEIISATPVQTTTMKTPPRNLTNPRSIARKIRRKRDRSLLFSAIGVLVSLSAVLGVLFFVLNRSGNRSPQPTKGPLAVQPEIPSPALPAQNMDNVTPRGSGLPRVKGLDGVGNAFPLDDIQNETNNSMPPDSPVSDPFDTSTPDKMDDQISSMPAGSTDTTSVDMPSPDATTREPGPAQDPELTTGEKEDWSSAIADLRANLALQKYDEAIELMVAIKKMARTKPQKAQFSRLVTVANLAQEFHESLVAAINGLSAGETFTVSSTPVSFIAGDESRVSLRIRGKNQRYPLTHIPIALAWSLADLKMDILHPRSLAKKSAFALLHPNNGLVLERAKKMMLEAAAAEQVPEDTPAAFEDDYQL